ncbi:MAG: TetR/AcrR family transcriptional regulator [Bacteroidales bacterium]|nr:TetR/AcrR family transcriptional regulator [Clostridium sp.]MCM1202959.1 TetR/AcrR family transcriptional regulator [Bacteroidales bacterium]
MAEDKETRNKLLDSAKQEFLEKGYMKASLRTICKNAGVTTGALYFFFRDKEDLLKQLVEEPLQGIISIIQLHLSEELSMDSSFASTDEDSEDIRAASEIVHFMYQNYDVFEILLTKSQGSAYEDVVSRFADWGEQHYNALAEMTAAKLEVSKPDHYMIHWMAHMQVDAFIHLFTHEPDEEKAVRHMEEIVVYLVSGWNGLFETKK